ncbi:MAG: hypothetical protein KGI66_00915 [Patescibacteria group bacterium]|nr:hypothetical protein [Patescibacteria group bacterium]
MNGTRLTKEEIELMISLRKTGHSLPEIYELTRRGYGTVYRCTKDIRVLPEYSERLKCKQGGSKTRADLKWKESKQDADLMLGNDSFEMRLCILACLYWGEGNKRELSLINSDPGLIKVFVECLINIGVPKEMIKVNLRLHKDVNRKKSIEFWKDLLSVKKSVIGHIEIIRGKKKGKLKYGMCRIRVAKSAPYFKLILSSIEVIKERFNAAVVQWIEQGTPKP